MATQIRAMVSLDFCMMIRPPILLSSLGNPLENATMTRINSYNAWNILGPRPAIVQMLETIAACPHAQWSCERQLSDLHDDSYSRICFIFAGSSVLAAGTLWVEECGGKFCVTVGAKAIAEHSMEQEKLIFENFCFVFASTIAMFADVQIVDCQERPYDDALGMGAVVAFESLLTFYKVNGRIQDSDWRRFIAFAHIEKAHAEISQTDVYSFLRAKGLGSALAKELCIRWTYDWALLTKYSEIQGWSAEAAESAS